MGPIKLCSFCLKCTKIECEKVDSDKSFECALCFGLCDVEFHKEFLLNLSNDYKKCGYDNDSYILALNLPTAIHLREALIKKLYGSESLLYNVKDQVSYLLLRRIETEIGLRPTLNSDFTLTINFLNDEFTNTDIDFLLCHFGEAFSSTGKKRKFAEQKFDSSNLYTKMKVDQITSKLTTDIAEKFQMLSPTNKCTYAFSFEREVVFIGGRYCKFSRNLPQSPWSFEPGDEPESGNSVSEKICKVFEGYFCADNSRFTASGREDIDVRMLGSGRPFAVQLLNCKKLKPLIDSLTKIETLANLQKRINEDVDIKISNICRVTSKDAQILNVGQEEKKKVYSAICYTQIPITEDKLNNLNSDKHIEIVQKTVVRVLKRRPLIDRNRTIYFMRALKLDDFHFLLKLETQAGTYVKEFVTGDFGRTRPSVADLMGVELGSVDILQLDVEHVDLDWPPNY